MRSCGHVLVAAIFCLSNVFLSNLGLSTPAAAQQSDQAIAEQVLGPQWKQLSRRAGMIFAGTVLTAGSQTANTPAFTETARSNRVVPATAPAIQLTFRVDQAIAGVEPGQILTIHEWAGAWAMQPPMRRGEHLLIFLYPPSRLGLTSPVGGPMGQVALDPTGKNVSEHWQHAPVVGRNVDRNVNRNAVNERVSVVQLERAIRGARKE